jgi:hypothetical protein
MAIYDLLKSQNVSTENLVIGDTSDESKYFSVFGCDSCYLDAGRRLANDIQTVAFKDVKSNATYEFNLCDSCIYEFEYPNEITDADTFYESLSSHIEPNA